MICRLRAIFKKLKRIERKVNHMSAQLDNLKAQVAITIDLEQRAITLIQTGVVNPADLDILTTQLKTSSDSLAAVVFPPTPLPPIT